MQANDGVIDVAVHGIVKVVRGKGREHVEHLVRVDEQAADQRPFSSDAVRSRRKAEGERGRFQI